MAGHALLSLDPSNFIVAIFSSTTALLRWFFSRYFTGANGAQMYLMSRINVFFVLPFRIKTNGSLPRDRRMPSPTGSFGAVPMPTEGGVGVGTSSISNNNNNNNNVGSKNSDNGSAEGPAPPTSPFLPVNDSDLNGIFNFDRIPEEGCQHPLGGCYGSRK